MDSITQIVLGAAVGEAVAGRKIGIKAALWGAIGGTIPDLDVFFRGLYHPFDAALVHRGFSHSLLFAVITGPLLGFISYKLSKKQVPRNTWILLWFLSIVTHPLLDMFTNYGTQFLWPLSNRISFNSVFVIDPLYTLPFLVCLIVALLQQRASKRRRFWNYSGLIYSTSYLLIGVIIKLSILWKTENYFKAKVKNVNQCMVTPMPLTSFYWCLIAESDEAVYVTYHSIFNSFNPPQPEIYLKNKKLLEQTSSIIPSKKEQFLFITNDYYTLKENHNSLVLFDLRFGTTKNLTGGKIAEPIMGYEIDTKKSLEQNTKFYRTRAIEQLDFPYYLDKVFGK